MSGKKGKSVAPPAGKPVDAPVAEDAAPAVPAVHVPEAAEGGGDAAALAPPQPPPPWLAVGIQNFEFKFYSGKSKGGTWWPGEILAHVAPGKMRNVREGKSREGWGVRFNYVNGKELGYKDQVFYGKDWLTEMRLDPKKDKARLDPKNAKKVKEPSEAPTARKGKKPMGEEAIREAGEARGRVFAEKQKARDAAENAKPRGRGKAKIKSEAPSDPRGLAEKAFDTYGTFARSALTSDAGCNLPGARRVAGNAPSMDFVAVLIEQGQPILPLGRPTRAQSLVAWSTKPHATVILPQHASVSLRDLASIITKLADEEDENSRVASERAGGSSSALPSSSSSEGRGGVGGASTQLGGQHLVRSVASLDLHVQARDIARGRGKADVRAYTLHP